MPCIYVMTVGVDLIKIGFASDPARRRYQVQRETDHPVQLHVAYNCDDANHRNIEAAIHAELKGCCVYREVFRMAPADALPAIASAFGLTMTELACRKWVSAPARPFPKPRAEGTFLPLHCRVARAILDWSVRDLAKAADVNFKTVSRFENGADLLSTTRDAIERTLHDAGIEFRPNGAVWHPDLGL